MDQEKNQITFKRSTAMIELTLTIIGIPALLYAIYYAGLVEVGMSHRAKPNNTDFQPNTLVVLPAYKPSQLFIQVLKQLEEALPNDYSVLVLFQEANQEIVDQANAEFSQFDIQCESFSHLGGNSYQHALKYIATYASQIENLQYVMLLDKDNLVTPTFFPELHHYGSSELDIIQGKRASLNSNGNIKFFDTISEILNDTMFRSAKCKLGLPLEISGSGALIKKDLFIHAILNLDPKAPGFDKNFMVNAILGQSNLKTQFVPTAILHEEKTSNLESYKNQRVRWFGEQYYNALINGPKLLASRKLMALDYFITLIRPPRSIMFAILPLAAALEFTAMILGWSNSIYSIVAAVLVFVSSFGLVAKHNLTGQAFKAAISFPALLISNIKSVMGSLQKRNLGKFIHTDHQL